jgi:hypothetical protein
MPDDMNLAVASDRVTKRVRLWASWMPFRRGLYCDGCGQRISDGELWTAEQGQEWCQTCLPLR